MRLHIANGRLIDPANGRDGIQDLFIADGRVVAVGQAPDGFQPDRRIDATGLAVLPGLVDLSARVQRQDAGAPNDWRLSLSELRAALAGGVTTLAMPPDADTPQDEPAKVEALLREAPPGHGRVLPIGALTVGLRGETLAEMRLPAQAGCLAFSQGESGIADTRVLWGAMRYAAGLGLALWLRPQDPWLGQGAVVAAGAYADRLGLEGLPPQAEVLALQTIFELQRASGARVHLSRLSTAGGLELLRAARREGLPVSADVSANSLHLTDVDIGYFNTDFHLRPPLRGQAAQAPTSILPRAGLPATAQWAVPSPSPAPSARMNAKAHSNTSRKIAPAEPVASNWKPDWPGWARTAGANALASALGVAEVICVAH